MKFVVDEPLPPALAHWLTERGHVAEHVVGIGLGGAPDVAIRDYAEATGAIIATKDEDYISLSDRFGAVQILWIRIGNAVNRVLLERLDEVWDDVAARLEHGEAIVTVESAPFAP